jgi:hypothetical protein
MNNTNTNINNNCNPNYYLIYSSSTFIFPIFYAYKKKNISLATASMLAFFGSINYWRKPCIGYRRNVDLITSKLSAIVYFYYGYNNVIGFWPKLLGFTNLYGIYYLYNESCNKFYIGDSMWNYYHILFHLCSTISKIYVIYWV